MTILQLLWFVIICILFMGFFFLEGFDFGVGMATRFLAKNDPERITLMGTIGPHWDGNEVWLITAGGAIFAAFPMWYASLFSGYYILLVLVLAALILRGVSFEFTTHAETQRGRNIWEWCLFIGSLVAPFLLCMMFFSMIQGVPIDKAGNVHLQFTDTVNALSVVGGVAGVLLCLVHGLNYIRLKTSGYLRDRARKLNAKLFPILFIGEVIFAILMYTQTDYFTKRPISSWTITVLIVLFTAISYYGVIKNKEVMSFVGSGLSLAAVVALIFNGLFPRVMIADNPAHSILIKDASSSNYTLTIMTIAACILLPIMLVYFIWSYTVFNKRVRPTAKSENIGD